MTLSIGVEYSGRPFASRSCREMRILGWFGGGVRPGGGGGAPFAVSPGGGRALPPGGAFSQIARSAMRAGSFFSSKFRARPNAALMVERQLLCLRLLEAKKITPGLFFAHRLF